MSTVLAGVLEASPEAPYLDLTAGNFMPPGAARALMRVWKAHNSGNSGAGGRPADAWETLPISM